MDAFFKIRERGSSVSDEIIGGVTTFLAMAYIVAVNPGLMEAAGIPFTAALTSTCLGAAIMTIAMGLIANRPIALASGMGINAIVAYTLCLGEVGVDWRVAMSVIFLEGIVILILVLCGLRKAIMDAIPVDLRRAIGIGIGLFIAFIGLKGGGIIAADESTILALGELSSPTCIVALVSIVVAVVLQVLKVKGGLIISIIAATLVGILFAICAFFAPIVGMVSSAATCGALVVVGYLMLSDVAEIDWKSIEHALPAFFIIIGIPMTYSITNGIGMGFIAYCIILVVQGRIRDIKPLMWVAALAFLVMFIIA